MTPIPVYANNHASLAVEVDAKSLTHETEEWIRRGILKAAVLGEDAERPGIVGPAHVLIYDTTLRGKSEYRYKSLPLNIVAVST